MCRKISAHVDGGLSGGSRVRRPWSEDPHRRERKFDSVVLLQGKEQMHAKLDKLCPSLIYSDYMHFLRVFFGLTNLANKGII